MLQPLSDDLSIGCDLSNSHFNKKGALPPFFAASFLLFLPWIIPTDSFPSESGYRSALSLIGFGFFNIYILYTSNKTKKLESIRTHRNTKIKSLFSYILLFYITATVISILFREYPLEMGMPIIGALFLTVINIEFGYLYGLNKNKFTNPEDLLLSILFAGLFVAAGNGFIGFLQILNIFNDSAPLFHIPLNLSRGTGLMGQPNHLAFFCNIGAAFGLICLQCKKYLMKRTILILIFSCFLGIWSSGSKSGLIQIIGILIILLGTKNYFLFKKYISILVVSIMFYITLTSYIQKTFLRVFEISISDPSSTSRFSIWIDSIKLMKDNPFLGVGVGNFNYAWVTVIPNLQIHENFNNAHNFIFNILAETGIIFTIAIVFLLLFVAKKFTTDCNNRLSLGFYLIFTVTIIANLFEYPIYYIQFLILIFFLLAFYEGSLAASTQNLIPSQSNFDYRLSYILNVLILCSGLLTAYELYRVQGILDSKNLYELNIEIKSKRNMLIFPQLVSLIATYESTNNLLTQTDVNRIQHSLLSREVVLSIIKFYKSNDDPKVEFWLSILQKFKN